MGNPRARNIMRIRNLTNTSIILALGTERLYIEPTQKPAIMRWEEKMIGSRHIEFGALHEYLQVPIVEDIAHVEGLPDPKPFTLFLVNHHVFSNCELPGCSLSDKFRFYIPFRKSALCLN